MAQDGKTVEHAYIVRRCKERACRLLAMHPARLWISHTGTPRVTVTCIKCGFQYGARFKRQEWKSLDEPS